MNLTCSGARTRPRPRLDRWESKPREAEALPGARRGEPSAPPRDLEDLALLLVGHEVRGQHLDDHVGVAALGRHVGVEVRLARLDGLLDGLERVAALDHVALDLPGELDVVGDVQIAIGGRD